MFVRFFPLFDFENNDADIVFITDVDVNFDSDYNKYKLITDEHIKKLRKKNYAII